ncbi:MAG: FG-GAP repeat protein, partial [Planctomycetota bacterium]
MFGSASLCLAIVLASQPASLNETNLTSLLTVSEAAEGDYFGSAVAIDGDTMVVGAS